ncbi:hypothetical protein [Cystobacter ferrugineus]|uniref:Uncharacterized protein n=1 Tax=Cystobacter ferrugineus TaxID=83449 RepID=A0A1L9B573_9BACT|nr:hypothetical protein [Cystobacter ferrugineus]OJH37404.1 hypothetical protein BON30_29420 [Cystobacter ferrugineus]
MKKGIYYTPRPSREPVTREGDPGGKWSAKFPDMMGYKSQGGGKVPEDLEWASNPKQAQEELTPESLAARHSQRVIPRLPETAPTPALPADAKPAPK